MLTGLLLLASLAQADSVSIIQLENRPAEEIIPVIEPMLGANDAITGQGFKVFLEASPQTLANVREMIEVLDRPAKVLQVSVFQGSERELRELAVSARLKVASGNASIDVGRGGNDDAAAGSITYGTSGGSASVDGISTQQSLRDNPLQQVRVTEGTEAYIQTGERIPYFVGAAVRGRRGIAGAVEYKDAMTGFYVLPRVRGDNVVIEISTFKSSRRDTSRSDVDTQSAGTTVTGPVGEWLLVGGVVEQIEQDRSDIGTSFSTEGGSSSGTWIKADLVRQ